MASAWHSQDGSQQHFRKERWTWKFGSPRQTADNRTSTRLSPVPCPLHKGTGGSEQQWLKPGTYTCGRWAYLQNSQWHPYSSHRCSIATGKQVSKCCQETNSEICPSKVKTLGCTLNNKAVGPVVPAVSFRGEVDASGFTSTDCWRPRRRSYQLDSGARKDFPRWKLWLQKALHNAMCSCCIRAWCSVSLTVVWVSQLYYSPTHCSTTGCASFWTCHQWKQNIGWSEWKRMSVRCRIPSIHSMTLSKKKRDVDWQKASHAWTKQTSQSSMCVTSYSWSK